ncbi:MAG: tyrosine-type recombinase/integrase [Bacteroidia bacterium]|nr:tyrosine-type recombinase/integrase [Bacteroidia bacterium]
MDVVGSFVGYIKYEKRYSDHTVNAYFRDISQFITFLSASFSDVTPINANFRHVRSWVVSLIEDSNEARSVNRKLSALNSFYKYLLREKIVNFNPTEKIVPPKNKKRLPVFVEEKQMFDLLKEVDFGEGFKGERDKLIIALFYSTGIRLSELISLKISDVDLHNNTIKVLGKRNKERIIPFGLQLKTDIEKYIIYRTQIGASDQNLFISEKGKKLYSKLIYRIVNHYIGIVAILDKKSPHILRHTFATHLLNNGADLNAIKELLGHANLAATQVYTHNSFEKLRNIYKKAHPRA